MKLSIILVVAALSLAADSIDSNKSVLPANGETEFTWAQAIPSGRLCWPDCLPGQWCWSRACAGRDEWPAAIVPIVAFGKLWMIGNQSVWSSDDGIHWRQSRSDAQWGERSGMTTVLFKDRIWKLGGMEKSWDNFRNDVWYSTDGKGWKLAAKHAQWAPRRGHSTIVFNNRLWVLGGAESSGHPDKLPINNFRDVWHSIDGISWTRATADAPWSGNINSVVFKGKIWVIGGGGAWYSADGRNWTGAVSNAPWLDRGGNGAAGCLVFDGKIWVFGGLGSTATRNDIWNTSDGVHWAQVTAKAPWTPRVAENSVVFENKLWIYGGKTGGPENGYSESVWHMFPSEVTSR